MSNQNMINSTSMPPQEVPAMPPGSKGLMDAGIKMLQDGRTESGENALYEAAVYFIKFGETPEKI